jgi:hypothetical protein
VVDNKLLFTVEEIFERQRRAVGAVELVLLVDLDHGKLAQLGGGSVQGSRDLLFLLQQLLAGDEPLFFRDNLYLLSVSALSCRRNVVHKDRLTT